MISINEAAEAVKKEFDVKMYDVKAVKTDGRAFVFLCRNKDKDAIPDMMIVAVNKATGKLGYSVFDLDAAVKASLGG